MIDRAIEPFRCSEAVMHLIGQSNKIADRVGAVTNEIIPESGHDILLRVTTEELHRQPGPNHHMVHEITNRPLAARRREVPLIVADLSEPSFELLS